MKFTPNYTRSAWVACLGIFFSLAAWAQPTNNPLRAYDPNLPVPHWSDEIRWNNIVNIQTYIGDVRDTAPDPQAPTDIVQNWWYAYRRAALDLVANGGGVLYFPARPRINDPNSVLDGTDGFYWFGEDLPMYTGVVIRGDAATTPDSTNARDARFKPRTYFEFPQYRYSTTPNPPGGVPANSTAFKFIRSSGKGLRNAGVVDVDINRAGISIQPSYRSVTVPNPSGAGTSNTSWAADTVKNIVVYGVRMNNVTYPDPQVPSGNISANHRYPWRFMANVNIYGSGNVSIVNCRFNDADSVNHPTRFNITNQSFGMNNYCANNIPGGGCYDNTQVRFDYNSHYGIILNRLKLVNFGTTPSGFLNNSTPDVEPELFAKGNHVEGNWIFKTSRVGVHIGGQGLVVKNNVLRDQRTKFTWLNPQGTARNANAVATYENRGIDVSGWGAQVRNNDMQVFRTQLRSIDVTGAALSADGEGFYSQGISGSQPRDYVFDGNTVRTSIEGMAGALASGQGKGFNGIWNATSIYNVRITNNNSGGMPIWLSGDLGSTNGVLTEVVVANNTGVRGIRMYGTSGGGGSYIANNVGSNDSIPGTTSQDLANRIGYSCHVRLNDNLSQPSTQNSNLQLLPLGACTPIVTTGPCANPYTRVALTVPVRDTAILVTAGAVFNLTAAVDYNSVGGCAVDSVKFYLDQTLVGEGVPDVGNTFVFPNWNVPTNTGTFYLRACANTASANEYLRVCSAPIAVTIVTGLQKEISAARVKLYPNPAGSSLSLDITGAYTGAVSARILDMSGRVAQEFVLNKEGEQLTQQQDISSLAPGVYMVVLSDGTTRSVQRLIKQ